ncbi:MAG: TRAP transporter fused permease subunit [Planctomycetota bacterium]|jgi:TRAP transporter 4TM/12TM fusion protein|nr:TRAP transporter fused permease subunit [Planctomycetota bacterium]
MNEGSQRLAWLERLDRRFLLLVGLSLAVFHIYTSYFGALPAFQHRVIHLWLSMMLVPLSGTFKLKSSRLKLAIDLISVIVLSVVGTYALSIADIMWKQSGTVSGIDVVLGTALLVTLLAFTWKVVGPALPVISIACLIYAMIGPYLPVGFGHRGYSWSRIIELLFKGVNGIYGTTLGVSSIYVAIFVIFASLLESSGAGDVFIRLTQSLLGGFRGGPAKVAVVASALFGTISGSAVANVVGTGSFTIPLMKRSGFRPEFAGAVETAASSGGQLMPPVMGAAAFIMADILGSYNEVVIAAIIPAILYYVALFMMIDLESLKYRLLGQPRSELPKFFAVLGKGWYLLLPLIVLLYLLVVIRYSPQKSAFFSICLLFVLCLAVPSRRERVSVLAGNIAKSASGIPAIALTTGAAGIIVSILLLTGIGYKLSSILVDVSGGNVLVLLFLTMVVSIILGMGLPTSGAYILLATLIAPALTDLGVAKIAAHFFVFYFGIMANVTPPVAIAAYTAAGIAGSDAMRTGFIAWRLSLAGFLLPFLFCLNPALLGKGDAGEIALAIVTATAGSFALACAVQRYFKGSLSWPLTILLFIGSVLMLMPGLQSDLVGCGLIAGCLYVQWRRVGRRPIA